MIRQLAGVLTIAALAACSGGGGSPASPAAAPAPKTQSKTPVKANATIFIPNRVQAKGKARAQWVSPSTLSVSIDAKRTTDGYDEYQLNQVAADSPNCTAVTGGRNCTLQFSAPVGVDNFTIYAYDAPDTWFGNELASAFEPNQTVTSGANSFTFTLGGIVAQPLALNPVQPFTVTHNVPSTLTFTIVGQDVDGNVIGLLDSPLTITSSDTTGAYTLSTTSVGDASGSTPVTITYGGANVPTTITVSTTSADSELFNYPAAPFTATIAIVPQ